MNMKCHSSFLLFHLLLLVLRCSGRTCGKEEYPLGDVRCCKQCPPGTEMKKRCTKTSDTDCLPCEAGSYTDQSGIWPCNPCTICDPGEGLQEVKPCGQNSNTVCICLPGFQPVGSESSEKRCDPCPYGYFSKGGDQACTPWTNCTANGRTIFQPGSKADDVVCDKPLKLPKTTEFTTKHPSNGPSVPATSAATPASTSSSLTALRTEARPSWVKKTEHLWFILLAAALLLLSGGIILHKILQKNKKNKELRWLEGGIQRNGKNSFRIPVQEEQIDTKASLVQN